MKKALFIAEADLDITFLWGRHMENQKEAALALIVEESDEKNLNTVMLKPNKLEL